MSRFRFPHPITNGAITVRFDDAPLVVLKRTFDKDLADVVTFIANDAKEAFETDLPVYTEDSSVSILLEGIGTKNSHMLAKARSLHEGAMFSAVNFAISRNEPSLKGIREAFTSAGLDVEKIDLTISDVIVEAMDVPDITDAREIVDSRLRAMVFFSFGTSEDDRPHQRPMDVDHTHGPITIVPNERMAVFLEAMNIDKDEFIQWCSREKRVHLTKSPGKDLPLLFDRAGDAWADLVVPHDVDRASVIQMDVLWDLLSMTRHGGAPYLMARPKVTDLIETVNTGEAFTFETDASGISCYIGFNDMLHNSFAVPVEGPVTIHPISGTFYHVQAEEGFDKVIPKVLQLESSIHSGGSEMEITSSFTL